MDAYLEGASCVSAQPSFSGGGLDELRAPAEARALRAVEPPYDEFFAPGQLRRTGRLARMSVAAARRAIAQAGAAAVDAVVTGSGLGCFEESEEFLVAMLEREEQFLNPSVFIQATHHAASSQVAFAVGCRGYHVNYAHRAFSFEAALLDAALLAGEGAAPRVLVGGMDELAPNYVRFHERAGLLPAPGEGAALGEGAAFFVLARERGPAALARLRGVGFAFRPEEPGELARLVAGFVAERLPGGAQPDLVLLGGTRGTGTGPLARIARELFPGSARAEFTRLCGEYHTASAFALWLAVRILGEGRVPQALPTEGAAPGAVRSVLILTHHQELEYAWTLLTVPEAPASLMPTLPAPW